MGELTTKALGYKPWRKFDTRSRRTGNAWLKIIRDHSPGLWGPVLLLVCPKLLARVPLVVLAFQRPGAFDCRRSALVCLVYDLIML